MKGTFVQQDSLRSTQLPYIAPPNIAILSNGFAEPPQREHEITGKVEEQLLLFPEWKDCIPTHRKGAPPLTSPISSSAAPNMQSV